MQASQPSTGKEETVHHGHAASAKARESDMAAGSQGKGRVPVKKVVSYNTVSKRNLIDCW